jgi:hypothetical protein
MPMVYKWLAGIVAVLAIVGLIHGKGQLDARHAKEIETLKDDLRTAEMVLSKEKLARQLDTANAAAAQERLRELNSRITSLTEYTDALEDRNRECLSGADTERLRDLWR